MLKAITLQTLILLLTFASCTFKNKEPVWNDLPEVTNLDSLKHTDFAITLEDTITENKNMIYAPAFLYVWDVLKKEINNPFIVNEPSTSEFKLLNRSNSYKNSLNEDEYTTDFEIKGIMIYAHAFFNKTLPFPSKLDKMIEPILFNNNTKVKAFGMKHYDDEMVKFTDILYYKADDHFVLKFTPKDKQHEIILVKGIESGKTLADAVKSLNALIDVGKKEQKNTDIMWKYIITGDDIFSIPVIKFNIATNYKKIEGQSFTSNTTNYSVDIAYQRTGFILDENGAVVESEAFVALEGAMEEESEIKHPKKMIFDKPFYIIVKHIDKTNPYFVMKVDNTELMTKH